MEEFVGALVQPGRINSLAQTLLKLTCPGVPDIYQGTELWDLSLVDPDNRRPVDFDLRRRLLDEVDHLAPEAVLDRMAEGLPKLWLIRRTLRLRRERPALFGPEGTYQPLQAAGPEADHAAAFMRGGAAVSVFPRLVMGLAEGWGDTRLDLPMGQWRNILTEDHLSGGAVPLEALLARFPVGLWTKET
jgi:(1->4)-alpha-D-glucan 1-alpha-D-glucosylmutase